MMTRNPGFDMVLTVLVLCLFWMSPAAYAGPSAIVVAEGYSCMGVDKSRRDTEKEAKADARRNAVENARTLIKSQTQVKDFQIEKDIVEAYAQANVTILEELKEGAGWHRDATSGDCYRYRIKAEVVPDEQAMERIAEKSGIADDPAAPLHVRIWTDKKEYRKGDDIRIYLKGNRPFYARVLYKDAAGGITQILPNPYRQENYFQGGVVFELPEGSKDRYRLEVAPPFGGEEVIVHASTAPLGVLDIEATGAVYGVKTQSRDMGIKSRGVQIVVGGPSAPGVKPQGAEFVESRAALQTGK